MGALKARMLAARMPNKAMPRRMSSSRMRSLDAMGPGTAAGWTTTGSLDSSSLNSGVIMNSTILQIDMFQEVHIIGGGLAGCEAAWQVARAGHRAILYEMRTHLQTPAHKTVSQS